MTLPCPLCHSLNTDDLYNLGEVPVLQTTSDLSTSATNSQEPLGKLLIAQCTQCSHVFNANFDQNFIKKIYMTDYSTGLAISNVVKGRFRDIAEFAIGKEHIEGKKILEIGASNFAFSDLLISLGAKHILAFEPSKSFSTNNKKISHIQSLFTSSTMETHLEGIDLVVMRHVLEHIPTAGNTLLSLTQNMEIGAKLYVEVPNLENILENFRTFDFFYEHISYFSPKLLSYFLEQIGFKLLMYSPLVEGQHFGLLAKKVGTTSFTSIEEFSSKSNIVQNLFSGLIEFTKKFDTKIKNIIESYSKVSIYGAGAHSIALTSRIMPDSKKLHYLFDINPQKEGKLSPLVHLPIRRPNNKALNEMDAIIIVASLHQNEIKKELTEKHYFKGSVYGTHPCIEKLI